LINSLYETAIKMPELGQVNRAVKELHDEGVMKGSVLLLLLLLVPSPSPSKRRADKKLGLCIVSSNVTGVRNTDSVPSAAESRN
jgi:hypothetical protein